ncbi:MAG: hypothetical protein KY456_14060, partial [Chloroflexi bacterium]|nr:hypothetical protein [Chloroflexota bacterium]
ISDDVALNQTLVQHGVTGVLDLAAKRAELSQLARERPQVKDVIERAERYDAILRAEIMESVLAHAYPANGKFSLEILDGAQIEPFRPPKPAPQTCQSCDSCHSALSPAAYLVELIAMMTESFTGFANVAALEARFHRPFGSLTLSCETSERTVRSIEIANRVLETFILARRAGLTRKQLFDEFTGAAFPRRTVLAATFDAFLSEIGTDRPQIHDALTATATNPPDNSKLDDLIGRLGLTKAELTGLDLQDSAIGIAEVEAMPALVRKVKTTGLNSSDPLQLAAHEDAMTAAEQAIDRVWGAFLPDLRANLIHAARAAIAQAPIAGRAITTSRELGNYLFIDLSVDACATTTAVAAAIEAIQTFVLAFQLGREPAQLTGVRADFDARWRWLQSYSLWHAAGMVFYYPENFAFPDVRWNQTAPFHTFLDDLEAADSPTTVEEAVDTYRRSVEVLDQSRQLFAVTCDDRTFLLAGTATSVEISEQRPDGTWRGWTPLEGLPGENLLGAVGFNHRIYLFFSNPSNRKTLRYTWMQPDGKPATTLTVTDPLGETDIQEEVWNIVFIGGAEHLTVYFRSWTYAHTFEGACMDHYHRWWRSIPPSPIDDWTRGYTFSAVGHLNGKDYLIGGTYGRVSLCEIGDPYGPAFENLGEFSDPRVRSTWTVLQDFPQPKITPSAAGTVSDGNLVLAIHGDPGVTRWTKHVPGTAITWVAALSSVRPAMMVKSRDLLYVYGRTTPNTGWVYRVVEYAGSVVGARAQGSLNLRVDLLARQPLGGIYAELAAYRTRLTQAYAAVTTGDFARLHLDEWYLFVPLAAAARLGDLRRYQDALNWLHLLYYPYRALDSERVIYSPMASGTAATPEKTRAWLDDPLNPHAIAGMRSGAYRRHVLAGYVETLLDWADTEFSRDTAESIARARELYELAEDLLGIETAPDPCVAAWRDILIAITGSHTVQQARTFLLVLRPLRDSHDSVTVGDLETILAILRKDDTYEEMLNAVNAAVSAILAEPEPGHPSQKILEVFSEAHRQRGTRIQARGLLCPASRHEHAHYRRLDHNHPRR